MSDPYRRTVGYDNWWEMIVEFSDVEEAHKQIKLMLEYRDIEPEEGDDIEEIFLQLLASTFIDDSMKFNVEGMKDVIQETDGFVSMDGKYGMKLIYIDEWVFEDDEFLVSEIEVQS